MAGAISTAAEKIGERAGKAIEDTAKAGKWRWAAGCVVLMAIMFGGFGAAMHCLGERAGRQIGYAAGYDEAGDETARTAWANTPQGKLAYDFAVTGELEDLAHCNRAGWKISKGVCFPHDKNGTLAGWVLP
jgi:hypothetical protein